MGLAVACWTALLLSACILPSARAEDVSADQIQTKPSEVVEEKGEQMDSSPVASQPLEFSGPTDPDATGSEDLSRLTSVKKASQEIATGAEMDAASTSEASVKTTTTTPNVQPVKVRLQAFGPIGATNEDESESDEGSTRQKDESWTEQTEEGSGQKRSGRRFFSLMNLIKFLLNPVLEEFQEVDRSNSSEIANKSAVNSSATAEKDESKNTTETGKKTKFECVGRNVTENTTAVVRIVNSTVLLELLSFDKNRSTSDCVLVMFYAPWCHFCAATAPHFNAVGRAFPQLDVLAVDTVHFSNLNARFGTVAVPNIMLFHQSRSAVRFNHTERHFDTLVQFIKNTTGLEPNQSVTVTEEDYVGPLSSIPTEETDYLLWFAWIFLIVCGGHLFIQSRPGQRAIEKVKILWQEHQHQHIE